MRNVFLYVFIINRLRKTELATRHIHMTDTYRQLKQQLPIFLLSIDVLFALRLLFDDTKGVVNLASDVKELRHFPERLFGSYRPEWEAYVTRAIALRLQRANEPTVTAFVDTLLAEITDLRETSVHYQQLLPEIQRARSIVDSDATKVFPSPWRQQIMALLLPVTTLYKPML